jgi:hypothetical protein
MICTHILNRAAGGAEPSERLGMGLGAGMAD